MAAHTPLLLSPLLRDSDVGVKEEGQGYGVVFNVHLVRTSPWTRSGPFQFCNLH